MLLLILFIGIRIVGTLYLPTLTADIINKGVVPGDMDFVWRTGAIMLGVAVLTGLFSILGTYFSAEVATSFAKNTRKKLFSHTQKLSYQDYKRFNTSSLITRATNDIEQLQTTISMFFDMMLPAPFVIAVGLILAFTRDTYMALIIIISSALMLVIMAFAIRIAFPLFARVQKGIDGINGVVAQYISGIRVVRAFNRTKLEQERMNESFQSYAKLNIKINRLFAVMIPVIMLIFTLVSVAVVWFGGHRINSGYMQIGDITAIMEYSVNILMYVLMATFSFIQIPRARVCSGRIREVLEHTPEIENGNLHLNAASDLQLEFKDVCFSYQNAENPVLHNLNFICKKGTTTAIIGGTGSGKSTAARLIPRLIDTTSGQVVLNGINIKELPQEELRARIGFVPQKAFLFGGTISENIKHGDKNATPEEIKQAAITAQADEFIAEREGGYDSEISQGGRNLSGGQRQRLAIARMLAKKPDIYVFDDSFSALDFKTDAALRKALKEVTQSAIVINIAQRISTIRDADQIIVLDEGKIVGKGTHGELLDSCEIYLEIAKSQLSEEELGA
jgi:ATP-binding cassette subfamily B protein